MGFTSAQSGSHSKIWEAAVAAERKGPVGWGSFRALVEVWLLDQTAGTFPPSRQHSVAPNDARTKPLVLLDDFGISLA